MKKYRSDLEVVEIEEQVETTEESPTTDNVGKGHHLLLKAMLGDKLIELILDTGASRSVFDPELAEDYIEAPEHAIEMKSSGVNAQIEANFGFIKHISIGSYGIERMPVGLTSLEHANMLYEKILGRRIWGLLGSDFLLKHDAIIDYRAKTLEFYAE